MKSSDGTVLNDNLFLSTIDPCETYPCKGIHKREFTFTEGKIWCGLDALITAEKDPDDGATVGEHYVFVAWQPLECEPL